MNLRKTFVQAKYERRDKLRKQGYVNCPMCEGMGNIADRFTHRISECPLCKGEGLIAPMKNQAEGANE